jgi:hypothetical protein
MILRFRILRLELMSKNKLAQSPRLEMEIIEAIGDF